MTAAKSVAIVTGASQGTGRAAAICFARDFPAVVLAVRDKEELEQTAVEVRSAGAEAPIYDLDLREPQSAAKSMAGTSVRMDGEIKRI